MIENRELGASDYIGMLRRHLRVLLIPAILAPLVGFGVSYLFRAKYTSQSLILVEEQSVPEGYVKPVVTEDITQRIATIQQQVLSRDHLQPLAQRLGLLKNNQNVDDVIADIRSGLDIEPVVPGAPGSTSTSSSTTKKKPGQSNISTVPGFYVNYTASNAMDAQRICRELSSLVLEENLKAREQVAQSTTDFLSRQVEDAKQTLDEQDKNLAVFKKQYLGQLPSDQDANLKILTGLNSQLDANTQALNRAQQDRTYSEALLAQEVAAWKASQSADNPQTIQQQLAKLQSQLLDLQSRYTDDHPDVAKTKRDIAELREKLKDLNLAAAPTAATDEQAKAGEPPEIRQLRMQIHQYSDIIAQANREQQHLQDSIKQYESRISVSPSMEEQYKALTRDYQTAQDSYDDLLSKKTQAQIQTDMERSQEGEQMRLLNTASLPDSPSFPLRWLFAVAALGAGLATGLAIIVLLEFQDKSIRDEKDAIAALDLPMFVAVPWIGKKKGELLKA